MSTEDDKTYVQALVEKANATYVAARAIVGRYAEALVTGEATPEVQASIVRDIEAMRVWLGAQWPSSGAGNPALDRLRALRDSRDELRVLLAEYLAEVSDGEE